jgi:hypothetical protein
MGMRTLLGLGTGLGRDGRYGVMGGIVLFGVWVGGL